MAEFCHILPNQIDCQTYWTGAFALVILCIGFNWLISWSYKKGWGHLTVVFQIAGDLLVTFFFGVVYSWEAAGVVLSLFVYSGIVMGLGAIIRNLKRKEADRAETSRALKFSMGGDGDEA